MDQHGQHEFPTDTAGLPAAAPRRGPVDLEPGTRYELRLFPVAKRIDGSTVRMLSYNGSIPGPTLRVPQGSELLVDVVNEGHLDTTVHWHGLRLDNRYDGVPHETQAPIPVGGRYTHRLTFPDAGLFWYHPHLREDYAQEMGLYGNVIVTPSDPGYWPPVDRELVLTLDDILMEDGRIASFDPHEASHVAMGRYGNVFLIGGETSQSFRFARDEVVRFLLTNTANTRVFKVRVPGCRMKLVGSDGGRYEHEAWVEDVVLAPSERVVVDVRFDRAGTFLLEHATPERTSTLASIEVADPPLRGGAAATFAALRTNDDMVAERVRIAPHLEAPPDKTLALVAVMNTGDVPEGTMYACPMHPEVTSDAPGRCPKCGMALLPRLAGTAEDPGDEIHHELAQHEHAGGHEPHAHDHHHHSDETADSIEWEDHMAEENRAMTPQTIRWMLVEPGTGRTNADIDWRFREGDQVKVRLVNEMDSDHPMHHPFHVHGERFLVLTRDGVVEPNLVWKDTVLVRTGETIEILMDASNPGLWMAHCHIAEHAEGGMMFSFRVDRAEAG